MNVIERDGLQEKAAHVGQYLLQELKNLAQRHKIIGDVRGAGLFVGVELVTDKAKRLPATAEAKYVVNRMREKKILISSEGPDNNILKFKPPMVFTLENVNHLVCTMEEVLQEIEMEEKEVIFFK